MQHKAVKQTAAIAVVMYVVSWFIPSTLHAQKVSQVRPPSGQLSLSAQVSAEIPQDVAHITLFYELETTDTDHLTDELNRRMNAAFTRVHGVPGITAHTSLFTVYPSRNRDGKMSAWHGRAEVVLDSSDVAAASKIAGELTDTLQISSVEFSLSPEALRTTRRKLTLDAIRSFRVHAEEATKAFGYGSYAVREVRIDNDNVAPPQQMSALAEASTNNAKESLPTAIEGGKATVTVTVSGSVQMQ